MSRRKSWVFIVLLWVLLSPLNIEAKVELSNMNLLENIETQSTEDRLTIKFNFKNDLKYFQQPIFYEKSIQVDFPFAYSQPAKKFLTTGNTQISQIYVSQFNARKMRVRFIFGKDENREYENRFHLHKQSNSLIVRIDLKQVDLLDQLLARATEKIEENKRVQSAKVSANVGNEKSIREPVGFQMKQAGIIDANDMKNGLSQKIRTASFNKNPEWKSDKKKSKDLLKPATKVSFNFLKSDDKTKTKAEGFASSGFKMIMTLSLVLGFIFLLFYGFKKYVLKNTVFGGGRKLIQVVSTNYLAPKKNISLVEVAGEILVLGVSDQNISLLTSIREPDRIEEIKNAHGNNGGSTDWKQGLPGEVTGKVSLAASNAKNVFSKYLKGFSDSELDKQASVSAVTEKIRRHMGKVRPA